jgi:ElaB/YqjD/DUF883 family membrane-anchored ribosome-binding protein
MRMYLLRACAYKNSATRPTRACQQTKEDSSAADVLRRNDPRTEMTEYSNQLVDGENLVDRAAHSAEQLLEATRKTANSAIDSATDKVHAVQHRTSPALDRLMAPVDSLVERTRAAPLTSLLMAAAVGATLMALAGFLRPSRQR